MSIQLPKHEMHAWRHFQKDVLPLVKQLYVLPGRGPILLKFYSRSHDNFRAKTRSKLTDSFCPKCNILTMHQKS